MSSSSSNKSSSQVGGGAAARVSIPSGVLKTIQQIKEITGNHSEEEIYAMLKECSMDPNDTISRLLFQDTFHEVKSKRERRRENIINKEPMEPKRKPGPMARGSKVDRGNFSSRYASQDRIGGRNSASGKENGNIRAIEKSLVPTHVPHPEEKSTTRGARASPPTTSTVSSKLSSVAQQGAPMNAIKRPNVEERPKSNPGPSSDTQLPAPDPVPLGSGKNQPVISSQMDSSHFSRPSSNYNNRSQAIGPQKAGPAKEWKPKATNSTTLPGFITDSSSESPPVSVEPQDSIGTNEITLEVEKKLDKVQISQVQHVIIPDHLHVPDAEKLGFCFGSFDTIADLSSTVNTAAEVDQSPPRSESSETSREQLASALPDDNPLSSSPKEEIESSKSAPENLQGNPSVQTLPSYAFIPPVLESSEPLARLPNFIIQQPFDPTSYYAQLYRSGLDGDGRISPFHPTPKFNGNVTVMSPPTQQPIPEGGSTLVLSTAATQPAVPQPPLPALFRQPAAAVGMQLPHYPPANYIPYGHYFSPFYPPPAIHQFFSGGAFPQPPLPPPSPKYSLSQFNKQPSQPNEDRSGPQFKDNNPVFGTGQQSEGSGVWCGSFYNLPAGIYHPNPPVTGPLLQQPNEMAGPTANMYQQSQMKWPGSY